MPTYDFEKKKLCFLNPFHGSSPTRKMFLQQAHFNIKLSDHRYKHVLQHYIRTHCHCGLQLETCFLLYI